VLISLGNSRRRSAVTGAGGGVLSNKVQGGKGFIQGGDGVVVKVVRIPEEVDRKLRRVAGILNMEPESVFVFALVRFLEVFSWMLAVWR